MSAQIEKDLCKFEEIESVSAMFFFNGEGLIELSLLVILRILASDGYLELLETVCRWIIHRQQEVSPPMMRRSNVWPNFLLLTTARGKTLVLFLFSRCSAFEFCQKLKFSDQVDQHVPRVAFCQSRLIEGITFYFNKCTLFRRRAKKFEQTLCFLR